MTIVAGETSYSFCQPYKNKLYCATSLHPDGTYSTWDYCDVTKCPLTGKTKDQCIDEYDSYEVVKAGFKKK